MGLLSTSASLNCAQWVKLKFIDSALGFAYNHPVETTLIVAAGSAYAFSYLDPKDAAYLTQEVKRHLSTLYEAMKPYLSPVYEEASKVCSVIQEKLQPLYKAATDLVYDIGYTLKPYIQNAELSARRYFYEEPFEESVGFWGQKASHINWKGIEVYGEPTLLTRLNEKIYVKTCLDMTGLFFQSSLINKVMPLGKYSSLASMYSSLYLFGETSSYVPID